MCFPGDGEMEGGWILEVLFEEFASDVSDAAVFSCGCFGCVQGDEFGVCVEG